MIFLSPPELYIIGFIWSGSFEISYQSTLSVLVGSSCPPPHPPLARAPLPSQPTKVTKPLIKSITKSQLGDRTHPTAANCNRRGKTDRELRLRAREWKEVAPLGPGPGPQFLTPRHQDPPPPPPLHPPKRGRGQLEGVEG